MKKKFIFLFSYLPATKNVHYYIDILINMRNFAATMVP